MQVTGSKFFDRLERGDSSVVRISDKTTKWRVMRPAGELRSHIVP